MNEINNWIRHIAHNYILIIIAAVLFFTVKAVIGFYTYKHYNKQLEHLHHKVDFLIKEQKLLAQEKSVPKDIRHIIQEEDPTESSAQTHLM